MARQQEIWAQLKQELAKAEFHVLDASDLGDEDTAWLQDHFNEQIFPVLTPQAIDPAHPFPFVPNKGFGLVFDLKAKGRGELNRKLFMLPASLPRLVSLPGDEVRRWEERRGGNEWVGTCSFGLEAEHSKQK